MLLFQYMAVVPTLIPIASMSGERPDFGELALQAAGGVLMLARMILVLVKDSINLPRARWLRDDTDMPGVRSAGHLLRTGHPERLFRTVHGPGAFAGGMLVGPVRQTRWLHQNLLAAVGYRSGRITAYGYQLTIAAIAITLILSPLGIVLMRRATALPRNRPPGAAQTEGDAQQGREPGPGCLETAAASGIYGRRKRISWW